MVECPTCGKTFDTEHAMKAHHSHHDDAYYDVVVRRQHGVEPAEFIRSAHHRQKRTLQEVADMLGGSVQAVVSMANRSGVEIRDPSEAKQLEWEQMSPEERQAQVEAAHEKTRELVEKGEHNLAKYWAGLSDEGRRELTEAARERQHEKYGDGGAIAHWVRENPDKHAEIAREAAPKGAPAREENGMAGRTGQDHPNWRGGKHLIDALRKQLRPSWWTVRDDERAGECYMCGASDCKLDVHHIVPISAGGTNESWNLMTLCESCHRTAEAYTRQFDAFDPVLTE